MMKIFKKGLRWTGFCFLMILKKKKKKSKKKIVLTIFLMWFLIPSLVYVRGSLGACPIL